MIKMKIKRTLTLTLIAFAIVSAPAFSLLRTPVAVPALAASREPVRARHGVVASTNEVASQVGVDIMKRGGNAVDAAVTVAFALAVTYPAAGNIGGGGFMLVHPPGGKGEPVVIEYRESAPGKASRDMFAKGSSTYGHKVVGVPGTVR